MRVGARQRLNNSLFSNSTHASAATTITMSSFSGPRRVNVSQYLRNLNVQGPSVEETFTDEDLDKDLALFTNTQFFDFETGQHTDYQAAPVKPETTTQSSPAEDVSPSDSILGDFSSAYDFPISGRSLFFCLCSRLLFYPPFSPLSAALLPLSWLGATIHPSIHPPPRASASEGSMAAPEIINTMETTENGPAASTQTHAHARASASARRSPEILLGAFPYHESGCRPTLES